MFRSFAADIRYQFQSGNTITRLIIINVAIFLLLMVFKLAITLGNAFQTDSGVFDSSVQYLFLSADLFWDARHPWVILTHMFTHIGFFHILFNMLVLYWFGRIAGDLLGDHRMLGLYFYSGLTGALLFLLTAPLIYHQGGSTLHGASAAIMGVVAAAGMTAPDYRMRLLLIGDVRLKYVVMGILLIYIIGIANLDNVGGHLAHLGGAGFGFFYVYMLRQGRDMTSGFQSLTAIIMRRKSVPQPASRPKVVQKIPGTTSIIRHLQPPVVTVEEDDEQDKLNAILDKIKRTGLKSLSEEEKKFLDEASQK